MENENDLPAELLLYKEFEQWFLKGRQLVSDFRQHGVSLPNTLELITKPSNGQASRSLVALPPPRPDAPSEAGSEWRWINEADASPQTLVLAFLNEGKPLGAKEIIARISKIHKDTNPGVIYNVLARLQDKKIRKSGKSWELMPDQAAPSYYKGNIWASGELLSVQELAAFRRMSVRHLMNSYSDGIKMVEIFRILGKVDWLKTPISKDLIKADLEAMEGKFVRQMGRSKKWKLIPEGQS